MQLKYKYNTFIKDIAISNKLLKLYTHTHTHTQLVGAELNFILINFKHLSGCFA